MWHMCSCRHGRFVQKTSMQRHGRGTKANSVGMQGTALQESPILPSGVPDRNNKVRADSPQRSLTTYLNGGELKAMARQYHQSTPCPGIGAAFGERTRTWTRDSLEPLPRPRKTGGNQDGTWRPPCTRAKVRVPEERAGTRWR